MSQSTNIGEAMEFIPEEFSEEEKVTGMWWRQLVAGGTAGVGEPAPGIACSHLTVVLV